MLVVMRQPVFIAEKGLGRFSAGRTTAPAALKPCPDLVALSAQPDPEPAQSVGIGDVDAL